MTVCSDGLKRANVTLESEGGDLCGLLLGRIHASKRFNTN